METITIVIADDHPIMLDGLKMILDLQEEFQIIGTARNGKEALLVADKRPSVMLIDVQMPGMNGIEATKRIKTEYPDICVLMLTSHSNGRDAVEAIAHGASGFLLKDWETEHIIQAIKEALKGKVQIPSFAANSIAEMVNHSDKTDLFGLEISLSIREQELAQLILNRYTNEEIADHLYLSVGTVKNYITALYKKLGVNTRREAIKFIENKSKDI